jgi:hypothetical protein
MDPEKGKGRVAWKSSLHRFLKKPEPQTYFEGLRLCVQNTTGDDQVASFWDSKLTQLAQSIHISLGESDAKA